MAESKYLYQTIYSHLKQAIVTNQYSVGDILPSERELCLSYGVERGTVRRALDLLIREGCAEKLPGIGTRVSGTFALSNQSAPEKRNREVGLIMVDDPANPRKISQPFYADLFYHLDLECRKNGFLLVYASISPDENIGEFLEGRNFSSIIYTSRTPASWIEKAAELEIPTILVNEQSRGSVTVSCNHADGAFQVIAHLAENGHKQIGIITGPDSSYTSGAKLSGCYYAFAKYGLDVSKQSFMKGNWEVQSGYECAKLLLSNPDCDRRPTAIFAFNDMMCIGALQAISDLSLSIPEDVSVVGFDNMEQLQYTRPDLTTVDANIATMSRIIVQCTISPSFIYPGSGLSMLVPALLIPRKTVRNLNE